MRGTILIVLSGLALSGCVTARKEAEVYSAISGIGFLEADARCISARAARSLSIAELRSLQRAQRQVSASETQMTIGQVVDAISDHVEPETLGTVTRLASECVHERMQSNG